MTHFRVLMPSLTALGVSCSSPASAPRTKAPDPARATEAATAGPFASPSSLTFQAPRFSVPRDFVEMPSQINDHWALEPSVFANYAKHFQTGELMPRDLVDRIRRAETFNQGRARLANAPMSMHAKSRPRAVA